MADDFSRAMREPPEGTNRDDPGADRLGSYPDAGELNAADAGHERVGQASGPGTLPPASDPTGPDAEIIETGGSGGRLGGPHATDAPGETARDPGLPGHDQPAEGGREQAGDGEGASGAFVDRLQR